jgi:hypothetical protein
MVANAKFSTPYGKEIILYYHVISNFDPPPESYRKLTLFLYIKTFLAAIYIYLAASPFLFFCSFTLR